MDKKFVYYITHDLNRLLSKRLKGRNDIIKILLECCNILITEVEPNDSGNGDFELIISKMKRIFFYCGTDLNKIFSCSFPFELEKISNEKVLYGTSQKIEITPYIISILMSLCNKGWFEENFRFDDIYDSIEALEDIVGDYGDDSTELLNNIIPILQFLSTYEIGYLRYDFDNEQENGKFHPLNHIDFYYTQSSTFKIGLNERASRENFKTLVDTNCECCFIEKLI